MKNVNQGSAVIEMTLLIPILLGIIYLYIMTMLFFVQEGKLTDQMTETLYSEEGRDSLRGMGADDESVSSDISLYKQGNTRVAAVDEEWESYSISLEYRRDAGDPVKNLRRWQLVADTIQ